MDKLLVSNCCFSKVFAFVEKISAQRDEMDVKVRSCLSETSELFRCQRNPEREERADLDQLFVSLAI